MAKSADAFRTISEVADWLDVQAHVLRFWESKFTQVKPIKRAGGRRYYRPGDMLLLGGIKKLLHDDGLTIKGVQKILREEGMSYVSSLSAPLDEEDLAEAEEMADEAPMIEMVSEPEPAGIVLPFDQEKSAKNKPESVEEPAQAPEPLAPNEPAAKEEEAQPEPPAQETLLAESEPSHSEALQEDEPTEPEPAPEAQPRGKLPGFISRSAADPAEEPAQEVEPQISETANSEPTEIVEDIAPDTLEAQLEDVPAAVEDTASAAEEEVAALEADAPEQALPKAEAESSEPAPPPAPKPRQIELPSFTPEKDQPAAPGILSKLSKTSSLHLNDAQKIKPLLAELTALRDRMAQKKPTKIAR
ncbi:MAG: MerR family transcriptional regulator [Sulfitobacter sp.]